MIIFFFWIFGDGGCEAAEGDGREEGEGEAEVECDDEEKDEEGNCPGDPEKILNSDRIVLPGVGAFAKGMEELHNRDFVKLLSEIASKGTKTEPLITEEEIEFTSVSNIKLMFLLIISFNPPLDFML